MDPVTAGTPGNASRDQIRSAVETLVGVAIDGAQRGIRRDVVRADLASAADACRLGGGADQTDTDAGASSNAGPAGHPAVLRKFYLDALATNGQTRQRSLFDFLR